MSGITAETGIQHLEAQPTSADAFERVRVEFEGMKRGDLLPLNIDPVGAAGRARFAVRQAESIRPTIAECLPRFDLGRLERINLYALALIHSQSIFICAKSPPTRVRALLAEGVKLRAGFAEDISGLARRGHVPGIRHGVLRGTTGYANVAADLLALIALLRQYWALVSQKTAVTEAELQRADTIASELILARGMRDRLPDQLAQATLDRQKAFTLCANAYEPLRQALLFLRWEHGDGEKYAPSFFGARKTRKRRGDEKLPEAAAPTAEATANEHVDALEVAQDVPLTNDPFLS
jgi:hypothetical protein